MNDLNRLFEDAAPEPVRGLSVDAVLAAARRRQRLRAGAVGLALALVLGGVGTAFAMTRGGGTQILQPATPVPVPTASPATGFTVDVASGEPDEDCAVTGLEARPTDGPPTPERAVRALLAGWKSELVPGRAPSEPAVVDTAGLLISVRLADGVAYVNLHDFTKAYGWASTSCGGTGFYTSFVTTLAPFGLNEPQAPGDVVRFAIEGDPRPVYDFFQAGCEDPVMPGDPCDPAPFAPINSDTSVGPPVLANEEVQVALLNPGISTCTETTLVSRSVPEPATPAGALRALFSHGPTEQEQAAGLSSWFSSVTADLLLSVRIDEGVAYLNLSDALLGINNLSTSCGTFGFLSQLDQTLKPFGVTQVLIAIEGDPDTAVNFFGITCDDPKSPGKACTAEAFRS